MEGRERPQIQDHDIEILRRSLVSSGLPVDSVAWLLDETRRLLAEREEIRAALAQLSGPWTDVRAVLNDLHRLTAGTDPLPGPPHQSRTRPLPQGRRSATSATSD